MIERLEQRQRRRLAVAILILFVGILLSVTVLPLWLANASQRAEIDQTFDRLQRLGQVAARDADLRPQYEQLKRSQMTDGHYIRSETVAVAGAELQRMVKDISAANRTQMLSTQILPAGEQQGFIRVALKVRLRGALPGVLQSLYDIETNEVFLFLENVSIRDSGVGRRPRQIMVKQMDAEFDLVAYMPDIS